VGGAHCLCRERHHLDPCYRDRVAKLSLLRDWSKDVVGMRYFLLLLSDDNNIVNEDTFAGIVYGINGIEGEDDMHGLIVQV
jgi:hypothetical protein